MRETRKAHPFKHGEAIVQSVVSGQPIRICSSNIGAGEEAKNVGPVVAADDDELFALGLRSPNPLSRVVYELVGRAVVERSPVYPELVVMTIQCDDRGW